MTAPTPPEVLRDQLACAFAETVGRATTRPRDYDLADAALAVFRGQQDPAVQRVEALADELQHEKGSLQGNVARLAAAVRIRAAIGGDGR